MSDRPRTRCYRVHDEGQHRRLKDALEDASQRTAKSYMIGAPRSNLKRYVNRTRDWNYEVDSTRSCRGGVAVINFTGNVRTLRTAKPAEEDVVKEYARTSRKKMMQHRQAQKQADWYQARERSRLPVR